MPPPPSIVGTSAWCYGEVIAYAATYVIQRAWPASALVADVDTKTAMRVCSNGEWGEWFRIRMSQTELDARFANVTDVTAASILAKLLTVDGTASGLDADKVRGLPPDAAVTANTIAQRDGSGDLVARLFRSTYSTLNASPAYVITQNAAGAGDNYYRPTSLAQFKTALSITVADVANAVAVGRAITAGNGLTGGGNLAADRAFAVGAGTGISVTATAVNVDATVWRDGNLPTTAQINGIIGYTPANNATAMPKSGGTFTGAVAGPTPTAAGHLATKGYVDAATLMYESAEQVITPAGLLTLAHGLGSTPKLVTAALRCKVAEADFAVGEEITTFAFDPASGDEQGVHIRANSTQIMVSFANTTQTFMLLGTNGNYQKITNSNFRLVIRAWK
jgi:hypothetical protein